jgi:hypothetical protein
MRCRRLHLEGSDAGLTTRRDFNRRGWFRFRPIAVPKQGATVPYANSSNRLSHNDLRMESSEPGWLRGSEQTLAVGDEVHCTEGVGHVARILGKTSDGSRLLELTLPDRPRLPFFAAASNVLIAPRSHGS